MPYRNVAGQLAGSPFASIEYREETGSTNADAAELLGDDAFGGHTIVAEFQRHGAGRKGRAWHAMPGTALLFSTILPRSIDVNRLWLVPFWVALAVRAGLRACGVPATLQWPNDLLLRDRKVGGILCQSRVTAATARVACGAGINVHSLAGAPTVIEPPPAFCDEVVSVDRPTLLAAILRAYDAALAMLDDVPHVTSSWEAAAEIPGRRYRIAKDDGRDPFEATAQSLEEGGGLRVVRDDGSGETVEMADARVLR
ncbi:MAG TPA: biotin--[acetyl-CoA-carboxylase] ligase [Candidatus Cybelea sp.]|nr:biotin--[acetyl-CoA-carboxylase] ligase [Candidatus Cybelea sp.]